MATTRAGGYYIGTNGQPHDAEGKPIKVVPQEKSGATPNLKGMTVKALKALPAWESVPDPKPTKKAEIIAALEEVM